MMNYRSIFFTGLLLSISLLSVLPSLGQGYSVFSGKVLDKQTQQPLAFVSLRIPSKGLATVTNEQGEFYLRIPKITEQEPLRISALGYKSTQLLPQTWNAAPKSVVVMLEKSEAQRLDSSAIKQMNGRNWAVLASQRVPDYTYQQPIVLTGFYRETLQQNAEFVDVREAIVRVEKDPRPKVEQPERTRVMKARRFESTKRDKSLADYEFPSGTALVTRSLELGPPDYLSGSSLNDYVFELDQDATSFDDALVYVFRFKPARESVKAARVGKLYVSTADTAIVRVEYSFTESGMNEVFRASMKSAMSKMLGKGKREAKRVENYMQFVPMQEGKWVLQDARLLLETDFIAKSDTLTATIDLRFMSSEVASSNGRAVPPTELPIDTSTFTKQRVPKYDEIYWSGQTHLLPTPPMREVIQSLQK